MISRRKVILGIVLYAVGTALGYLIARQLYSATSLAAVSDKSEALIYRESPDSVTKTWKKGPFVYAKHDLPKGKPISANMVEIRVSEEEFRAPSGYNKHSEVVGKVPNEDIPAGLRLTPGLLGESTPGEH